MPLIQLHTSAPVPEDKRAALLASLSKLVAECIGKPEQYVMATMDTQSMLMSGKPGPAALAEVRSIGGLNGKVNRLISSRLCELLQEQLSISPERCYLTFMDISASDWGWRGETFG
jgi:phenylpyruvate tautomerase